MQWKKCTSIKFQVDIRSGMTLRIAKSTENVFSFENACISTVVLDTQIMKSPVSILHNALFS